MTVPTLAGATSGYLAASSATSAAIGSTAAGTRFIVYLSATGNGSTTGNDWTSHLVSGGSGLTWTRIGTGAAFQDGTYSSSLTAWISSPLAATTTVGALSFTVGSGTYTAWTVWSATNVAVNTPIGRMLHTSTGVVDSTGGYKNGLYMGPALGTAANSLAFYGWAQTGTTPTTITNSAFAPTAALNVNVNSAAGLFSQTHATYRDFQTWTNGTTPSAGNQQYSEIGFELSSVDLTIVKPQMTIRAPFQQVSASGAPLAATGMSQVTGAQALLGAASIPVGGRILVNLIIRGGGQGSDPGASLASITDSAGNAVTWTKISQSAVISGPYNQMSTAAFISSKLAARLNNITTIPAPTFTGTSINVSMQATSYVLPTNYELYVRPVYNGNTTNGNVTMGTAQNSVGSANAITMLYSTLETTSTMTAGYANTVPDWAVSYSNGGVGGTSAYYNTYPATPSSYNNSASATTYATVAYELAAVPATLVTLAAENGNAAESPGAVSVDDIVVQLRVANSGTGTGVTFTTPANTMKAGNSLLLVVNQSLATAATPGLPTIGGALMSSYGVTWTQVATSAAASAQLRTTVYVSSPLPSGGAITGSNVNTVTNTGSITGTIAQCYELFNVSPTTPVGQVAINLLPPGSGIQYYGATFTNPLYSRSRAFLTSGYLGGNASTDIYDVEIPYVFLDQRTIGTGNLTSAAMYTQQVADQTPDMLDESSRTYYSTNVAVELIQATVALTPVGGETATETDSDQGIGVVKALAETVTPQDNGPGVAPRPSPVFTSASSGVANAYNAGGGATNYSWVTNVTLAVGDRLLVMVGSPWTNQGWSIANSGIAGLTWTPLATSASVFATAWISSPMTTTVASGTTAAIVTSSSANSSSYTMLGTMLKVTNMAGTLISNYSTGYNGTSGTAAGIGPAQSTPGTTAVHFTLTYGQTYNSNGVVPTGTPSYSGTTSLNGGGGGTSESFGWAAYNTYQQNMSWSYGGSAGGNWYDVDFEIGNALPTPQLLVDNASGGDTQTATQATLIPLGDEQANEAESNQSVNVIIPTFANLLPEKALSVDVMGTPTPTLSPTYTFAGSIQGVTSGTIMNVSNQSTPYAVGDRIIVIASCGYSPTTWSISNAVGPNPTWTPLSNTNAYLVAWISSPLTAAYAANGISIQVTSSAGYSSGQYAAAAQMVKVTGIPGALSYTAGTTQLTSGGTTVTVTRGAAAFGANSSTFYAAHGYQGSGYTAFTPTPAGTAANGPATNYYGAYINTVYAADSGYVASRTWTATYPQQWTTLSFELASNNAYTSQSELNVASDDMTDRSAVNLVGNYALSKNVYASSVFSSGAQHAAANAVDGTTDNYWIPARTANGAAATPQWIYVDLETPTQLDRVFIQWDTAGTQYTPSAYQIQTSNDAQTWTPVWTVSAYSNSLTLDANFGAVTARYVRVYVTSNPPSVNYFIMSEMSVYSMAAQSSFIEGEIVTDDLTVPTKFVGALPTPAPETSNAAESNQSVIVGNKVTWTPTENANAADLAAATPAPNISFTSAGSTSASGATGIALYTSVAIPANSPVLIQVSAKFATATPNLAPTVTWQVGNATYGGTSTGAWTLAQVAINNATAPTYYHNTAVFYVTSPVTIPASTGINITYTGNVLEFAGSVNYANNARGINPIGSISGAQYGTTPSSATFSLSTVGNRSSKSVLFYSVLGGGTTTLPTNYATYWTTNSNAQGTGYDLRGAGVSNLGTPAYDANPYITMTSSSGFPYAAFALEVINSSVPTQQVQEQLTGPNTPISLGTVTSNSTGTITIYPQSAAMPANGPYTYDTLMRAKEVLFLLQVTQKSTVGSVPVEVTGVNLQNFTTPTLVYSAGNSTSFTRTSIYAMYPTGANGVGQTPNGSVNVSSNAYASISMLAVPQGKLASPLVNNVNVAGIASSTATAGTTATIPALTPINPATSKLLLFTTTSTSTPPTFDKGYPSINQSYHSSGDFIAAQYYDTASNFYYPNGETITTPAANQYATAIALEIQSTTEVANAADSNMTYQAVALINAPAETSNVAESPLVTVNVSDRTVQAGPNLLTSNQATNEGAPGWTAYSGVSTVNQVSTAHSGTYSSAFTGTGNYATVTNANGIAVSPSTSYTFSFWMLAASTSLIWSPEIEYYDASNAFITGSYGAAVSVTSGAWVQLTVTLTSPSNAAKAILYAASNSGATGLSFYFDDSSFTTPVVVFGPAENGTATDSTPVITYGALQKALANEANVNATESQPTVNALLTNATANPNLFSANIADNEVASGWSNNGNTSVSRSAAAAHKGSYSTLIALTATSGSVATSAFTAISASGTYTFTYWMQAVNASNTWTPTVYYYDSAQAVLTGTNSSGSAVTASVGTWTQGTFTFTAPASAAYVLMVLTSGAGTVGNNFYLDDASLSLSTTRAPENANAADSTMTFTLGALYKSLGTATGPNLLTGQYADSEAGPALLGDPSYTATARVSTFARTGTYSTSVTTLQLSGVFVRLNNDAPLNVTPGMTYALSAWVKGGSTTAAWAFTVRDSLNSSNGIFGTTTNVLSGGSWTQITMSYTAPAVGTGQIYVALYTASSYSAGAVWYVDDLSINMAQSGVPEQSTVLDAITVNPSVFMALAPEQMVGLDDIAPVSQAFNLPSETANAADSTQTYTVGLTPRTPAPETTDAAESNAIINPANTVTGGQNENANAGDFLGYPSASIPLNDLAQLNDYFIAAPAVQPAMGLEFVQPMDDIAVDQRRLKLPTQGDTTSVMDYLTATWYRVLADEVGTIISESELILTDPQGRFIRNFVPTDVLSVADSVMRVSFNYTENANARDTLSPLNVTADRNHDSGAGMDDFLNLMMSSPLGYNEAISILEGTLPLQISSPIPGSLSQRSFVQDAIGPPNVVLGTVDRENPNALLTERVAAVENFLIYDASRGTSTTDEWWSINNISLSQQSWNITTVGGSRFGVPNLRGDDLQLAFRPGRIWVPKTPDSRVITLIMWMVAIDPNTGKPPTTDQKITWNDNWNFLRRLFFTPKKQLTLTRRWKLNRYSPRIDKATAKVQLGSTMEPQMTGRTRGEFSVDLVMADPFFYGSQVAETVPVSIVGSTALNLRKIYQPGDDTSGLINMTVTLYGPLVNPRLVNKNGAQGDIWFKLLTDSTSTNAVGTITAGQYVTFNVEMFKATRSNGQIVTQAVTHSGGIPWFALEPGENNVVLEGDAGSSGYAVIRYQPPYL